MAMVELARLTAALDALEACHEELALLTKDESCDHSAGICWCATFRARDQAAEMLRKAGRHAGR
jgi:hypothetical protein